MSHPPYLRAKARELRTERRLTIDEIAERLALSRSTIYHWVRDLAPIERSGRPATAGQLKGNMAMQTKYRLLREAAYAEGRASSTQRRSSTSVNTTGSAVSPIGAS